jgi:DNA primase
MTDFAQSLKAQADIVKIVEEYVRLRKTGAQNYSGLCPFHKEKSPSFSVQQVKQFYHCFGCGQSGDVFRFIERIENVSFPEAVRIVAGKLGVAMPKREFNSPEEAAESRQRGRLLELHEAATAWFEEQLQTPEGATARSYLASRGLKPEGIARFRIGYAPDNFNTLREYLRKLPYADEELLRASGMFGWKEQEDGSPGPIYARFRKRVMFPIANEAGRVIAFTARTLDTGDKTGPKYMNSPETPLYSKGQVLFNLDKAKAAIRANKAALLVEGQMDCITVFLAGIQSVIATSGTAFTEAQVALLHRHTDQVYVNFDPDTAGANAAEKSIALLTEEGFSIKIITLEDGLDPDRFVRERGLEAYTQAIKSARRQSDYLIERARLLFPGYAAETKVKAVNFLLPHIRRIPNKMQRDQFAADAAQKLGIDSAVLREELRQAALKRREAIVNRPSQLTEVDRTLIRALAMPQGDPARALVEERLQERPDDFAGLASFDALLALARRGKLDAVPATEEAGEEQQTHVARILMEDRREITEKEAAGALITLQIQALERQRRQLMAELSDAEKQGDWAALATITQQKQNADRELRRLHELDEAADTGK